MDKELLDKYFSGNCTEEACIEAEQWIEDNLFTDEFDAYSEELLGKMSYYDPAECRRMLDCVHRRINSSEPHRFRPRTYRAAMAWLAASVAVLLAIAVWALKPHLPQVQVMPAELVECYASNGSSHTVLLPDSTLVTLYADSRIVYDRNNFATTREVWLFGDAYFDVAHLPQSSFEVKCSNSTIRVLGTRFSVMSHDIDKDFEVSLYEGRVRLASSFNNRHDTLNINKGEYVRIDKQHGEISMHTIPGLELDTVNIVYADTRLSDIAARLERHYGKTIIIDDNNLANHDPRLYLMFEADDSLDNVIGAICALSGLKKRTLGHDKIVLSNR